MEKTWQLQKAKNKFSEVVACALKHSPQHKKRHGKAAVVIVATKEFEGLMRDQGNLAEFFLNSPLRGLDLENTNWEPGQSLRSTAVPR